MRYLVWDFDGTLGYREGMWSGTLLEVLHAAAPDFACTIEQLSPHLGLGFPWHDPETPHTHLTTPDDWWAALDAVFTRAYCAVGVTPHTAARLAREVRRRYAHLDRWRLYPDTLPTLDRLAGRGWRHVILSNHVPELTAIIGGLQLASRIERVFNSAELGYEKPHPRLFAHLLDALAPHRPAWMIGDNPDADIRGAHAVGLRGILVRRPDPDSPLFAPDLSAAADLIESLTPDGDG